jgi:hypothetical protein
MRFRPFILAIIFLVLVPLQSKGQSDKDTTTVEEITVFSTRGINPSGARYHLDGCRYLKNGQIKVDERQALDRGLLPCSICLPDRTKDLPFLRGEKEQEVRKAYRKCVFKTQSGSKCERAALEDSRYCELHESRSKKK